ncbi:trehalose-phosphatase [Stutzerimonas azotifigens]|uniref:trehalose-phosphatase n=1 Tax=Stutzerimonas azotifigens TaxID=291995 RepID=UPI0005BA163C|nr:trehalose-phosphatase [Stutzerimonas azotifigens]
MTDQLAPPALDLQRTALFLDVDGTLADIQPRPEQVFIPRTTLDTLAELQARGCLVAAVSGRRLADIDTLLSPLVLPGAGIHGTERRDAAGRLHRLGLDEALLAQVGAELERACALLPGVRLEGKGVAFALHYRQAPEREAEVAALASEFVSRYPEALVLQPGKCVFELKPKGASKGGAIEAFMHAEPFAGRLPVFVGDDLTDEAGFEVVNRLDGWSVKVGAGETCARMRLPSVPAVADWLRLLLDTPAGRSGASQQNKSGDYS